MSKTTAAIILFLSIPLAAGLAWTVGGMFQRFGSDVRGWLGGLLSVPLTTFAVFVRTGRCTMTSSLTETLLLDGKVKLRPDEKGGFDELFVYDKAGGMCSVHAEMMDDNCLWIAFYPPGEKERRVSVWIRARGKLSINAFED